MSHISQLLGDGTGFGNVETSLGIVSITCTDRVIIQIAVELMKNILINKSFFSSIETCEDILARVTTFLRLSSPAVLYQKNRIWRIGDIEQIRAPPGNITIFDGNTHDGKSLGTVGYLRDANKTLRSSLCSSMLIVPSNYHPSQRRVQYPLVAQHWLRKQNKHLNDRDRSMIETWGRNARWWSQCGTIGVHKSVVQRERTLFRERTLEERGFLWLTKSRSRSGGFYRKRWWHMNRKST